VRWRPTPSSHANLVLDAESQSQCIPCPSTHHQVMDLLNWRAPRAGLRCDQCKSVEIVSRDRMSSSSVCCDGCLSVWWCGESPPLTFRRVPLSGPFPQQHTGDVCKDAALRAGHTPAKCRELAAQALAKATTLKEKCWSVGFSLAALQMLEDFVKLTWTLRRVPSAADLHLEALNRLHSSLVTGERHKLFKVGSTGTRRFGEYMRRAVQEVRQTSRSSSRHSAD
jgi:hypothetical protein